MSMNSWQSDATMKQHRAHDSSRGIEALEKGRGPEARLSEDYESVSLSPRLTLTLSQSLG
jgi:hypothetical protein